MRRASASLLPAHHDCQPAIEFQASPLQSVQQTEIEHRKLAALPAKKTPAAASVTAYMELELGLAPPSARHHLDAEDELSSTSSDHHPCAAPARAGKRRFAEAFQEAATTTLPLFDDGSSSCGGRNGGSSSKRPLVGWPPVSSARSRACGGGATYVKVKKEGDAIGRKVDLSLHASYDELLATLARMFPTNSNSSQDDKEISSTASHVDVVVTYEDGEGDWMLVGDVPWDDFARSVKRLKILG